MLSIKDENTACALSFTRLIPLWYSHSDATDSALEVQYATTQTLIRTLPDIFYEDPEPVEDGMQQAIPLIELVSLLHKYYVDRSDVYVGGGGFVMYVEKNGNARVAPDCDIAFGVDEAGIREKMVNFWVWRIGKVPDFVMEMASPSTAANNLGRKRDLPQGKRILTANLR